MYCTGGTECLSRTPGRLNHQPSQSSICTAQVVLNASVTHPGGSGRLPGCVTEASQSSICTAQVVLNASVTHPGGSGRLPGCVTEAFSTTCAVHIEDCEGWWLSGCRSSVAEHWRHKPGVLGSTHGGCRPFSLSSIFAS